MTPGFGPSRTPRTAGGRAPPPGAPRGEQRPPARARSQSWGRRAGVRPPGSTRAPPPTGIVLAATSGPSTPPLARPGLPPAPRRAPPAQQL